MRKASVGRFGKLLRKPWYALWQRLQKYGWEGREYVLQVPSGHRIYTPWFWPESNFSQLLHSVSCAGPLSVSLDRCYILYQFCQRSLNLGGDMAECGVYTGGTANLLASTIQTYAQKPYPRLHLFDTFSGMPTTALPERDYHSPGDFADTSLKAVQQRLEAYRFVVFHPGVMPQTFEEISDVPLYSFVHVDVDIFSSVFDCCTWFWPRLCQGGAIVFDDYGFYPYRRAARAAVDQFFDTMKEEPIVLPTGQAIVLKL